MAMGGLDPTVKRLWKCKCKESRYVCSQFLLLDVLRTDSVSLLLFLPPLCCAYWQIRFERK